MKEFYTSFYAAVEHSRAHHEFCARAFGKDLCQHGFADLAQLDLFLKVTQVGSAQHVLDLGCGDGQIAEYISDSSGARVTGLDYIPQAVTRAQRRTATKSDRLSFVAGDMNHLELPPNSFDVVLSIDTIYFCDDLTATIGVLKTMLRAEGQMALFYSYGREPHVSKDEFPKDKLLPEKTPLADAFRANNLAYRFWDLTRQDYDLARRRREILTELKPEFEAEDITFIYENRLGEANGICQAFDDGLHARYLYHVQTHV